MISLNLPQPQSKKAMKRSSSVSICSNVYVYEDHLEVHMFARCNGDLIPLWIKAHDNQ